MSIEFYLMLEVKIGTRKTLDNLVVLVRNTSGLVCSSNFGPCSLCFPAYVQIA